MDWHDSSLAEYFSNVDYSVRLGYLFEQMRGAKLGLMFQSILRKEFVLAALKIAGMLLSAILAVFGLLVGYKEPENQHIAIVIIALSATVAVIIQVIETVNKVRQERRQVQKERLRKKDIQRGAYPLDQVWLDFSVGVDLAKAHLEHYAERLGVKLRSLLDDASIDEKRLEEKGIYKSIDVGLPTFTTEQGETLEAVGADYKGETVDLVLDTDDAQMLEFMESFAEAGLAANSEFQPDPESELLASAVLGAVDLRVEFYRKPLAIEILQDVSGDRQRPDLIWMVHSRLTSAPNEESHELFYRWRRGRMILRAFEYKLDPLYWDSSGEIVGIADLLGAQMIIRIGSSTVTGDPEIDCQLPGIRRGFTLDDFTVTLPKGLSLNFDGSDLESYVDLDGFPIYVQIFPETMEELKLMFRRSQTS